MDMGTGKTITTIAVAGALFHKRKALKMLVVAPKSIVDVWDEEFRNPYPASDETPSTYWNRSGSSATLG